jgi:hypothetical protein
MAKLSVHINRIDKAVAKLLLKRRDFTIPQWIFPKERNCNPMPSVNLAINDFL